MTLSRGRLVETLGVTEVRPDEAGPVLKRCATDVPISTSRTSRGASRSTATWKKSAAQQTARWSGCVANATVLPSRARSTRSASDINLMPVLIDTVKAYATVGEICDVQREVFGEYQVAEVY